MLFVVMRKVRASQPSILRPKFRHTKHLLGPAYKSHESSGLAPSAQVLNPRLMKNLIDLGT
jgi:hypothetical protein